MSARRYKVYTPKGSPQRYASDLNDREWTILAPLIAQKAGSGKRRTVNMREVLNALFYRVRTGCQWRMLPKDFPPWYHVWYYYRTWRDDGTWTRINTALRRQTRVKARHNPEPSVAMIDSQSVKTTELADEKGFDPNKLIKGHKRHLLVDTLGLILFVVTTAASVSDSAAAAYIIDETAGTFPRLQTILADQGYAEWVIDVAKTIANWTFVIMMRPPGQKGFVVQPQRWKVERTLGWLNWERLLGKEYERSADSSQTNIYIASIRLMLRRLIRPRKKK
jgi:putative transposase